MEKTIELKRPVFNEVMIKELAIIVAKVIVNYTYGETNDYKDCIEDAEKVLAYNYREDGYHLAKRFEEEGYKSGSDMVEDLDFVFSESHTILKKHVKNWVSENDIKLDFEVGDIVYFNEYRDKNIEAEIVELYPETAQYGLWNKSMGYEKRKGHTIIDFENVMKK